MTLLFRKAETVLGRKAFGSEAPNLKKGFFFQL